ncbi:MAG: metallophosphoesterase [Chloroflexi bacterium]|nr:metallophosphoesterase [Chloroflexota bacterium]
MSPSSQPLRPHYRLLAVSDKVEPRIYGPSITKVAGDVDLIIACGDLPYYYLEYIVSMLNRPFYYVHGNHDRPEYRSDKRIITEPLGGTNLHQRVCRQNGLLIAGLEGSHRYNANEHYQYTQGEMWSRVLALAPTLLINRLLYGRYLDLMVAHSPPFGIHDGEDRPHIGFHAFLALMRWFKPRYFIHGHQHVYSNLTITRTRYQHTEVINVYPFKILDLDFSSDASPR